MIDFVKVGLRIAEHRKRLGLNQEELADKLFVTRQAVSKWERGASAPSLDTLGEMRKLFSVSIEELLGLFEPIEEDGEDIFLNQDRGYIINKLISGELDISVADVLYRLSPAERMLVLRRIKEGKLSVPMETLIPKLTPHEQKFLHSEKENPIWN